MDIIKHKYYSKTIAFSMLVQIQSTTISFHGVIPDFISMA